MIRVDGVSKVFCAERRSWKDALLRREDPVPAVKALHEVSVVVPSGAAVGLVGPNGAGKTTLMRIVAGVLTPDAGTVAVDGRVGSLLELGAGFHPDLTGRESAVLAGVIAGASRRAARARVDDVREFSGLQGFIDRPLRTYSTGMQARLAFAIATVERPDLLLVDEVLAVGDVAFQQRCIERIRSFQRAGTTLFLVSHDPDLVRLLCERAVWLAEGRVMRDDDVDDVLDAYLSGVRGVAVPVSGSGPSVLGDVRLLDARGRACTVLNAGAPLVVDVDLGSRTAERCRVAVRVVRDDELVCVDSSTVVAGDADGAVLRLDRLDLAPGRYRVEVGVYDESWHEVLAVRGVAGSFRVLGTASAEAALAPPATWSPVRRGGQGLGFGTD